MEDECSSGGAEFSSALGLRVIGLFGILAASIVGVAIPWLSSKADRLKGLFFLGKTFASGVVLATGFVHVLTGAVSSLQNPCLGLTTQFPLAFTLTALACLATHVLEFALKRHMASRLTRQLARPADVSPLPAVDLESVGGVGEPLLDGPQICADCVFCSPDPPPEIDEQKLRLLEQSVVATTLEAGIIFHSVFVGITLGVSQEPDIVRSLMIALMFHQGFEGMALGSAFVRAQYSSWRYVMLAALFALTTPLGIVLGIGITTSYNPNSAASLAAKGGLSSISAGILIYMALVDLLVPEFEDENLPEQGWLQVLGVSSAFAGCGAMSLLAIWA